MWIKYLAILAIIKTLGGNGSMDKNRKSVDD